MVVILQEILFVVSLVILCEIINCRTDLFKICWNLFVNLTKFVAVTKTIDLV